MRIDRIELRHTKMILVTPFVTSMGTEYDEQHIARRDQGESNQHGTDRAGRRAARDQHAGKCPEAHQQTVGDRVLESNRSIRIVQRHQRIFE